MKKFLVILTRLLLGILLLAGLLATLFAVSMPVIHRWGATREELTLSLPGDELFTDPLIQWTHAITIDAPPEDIWPWIAQLGDTRGGFYSYTFIENRVGALTGAPEYSVVYVNADRIHPEWQNPQPGDEIIQGQLKIRAVEPGQFLLADSVDPTFFYWVWSWSLKPVGEKQTRMYIRFAIDVPQENNNPAMAFLMDIGGFVMENNMMQGIKTRAEGGTEPVWIEALEIGLWFTALVSGLAAGILFLFRSSWRKPLLVAVVAVVFIFILTIVQPIILIRVVMDGALIIGLAWSLRA